MYSNKLRRHPGPDTVSNCIVPAQERSKSGAGASVRSRLRLRTTALGILLGIFLTATPLKSAFAQSSTNVVLTVVLNLTAYIQQPGAGATLPTVKVQRFATKDVVAAIGSDLGQPADSLSKAKLLLQFAGIGNTNAAVTNMVLRTAIGDNNANGMFSLDFPSRLLLLNNYDIHTDRPGSNGTSNRLDYTMMTMSLNTSNLRFEGQGRVKLNSASVTAGKTLVDSRLLPSGYSCSLTGSGKVGANDAMFTGTFTASSRKVEVR